MNTREVQAALVALGYPLVVDGAMGPKTKAAVVAFQRKAGLYPDGIVGPKTTMAMAAAANPDNAVMPAAPWQSMSGLAAAGKLFASGYRLDWLDTRKPYPEQRIRTIGELDG